MNSDTSIYSLISLKDQVALITGGAGHLGSAMALVMAELGANILLLDRDLPSLEIVKKEITSSYDVQVECIVCDLSVEAEVAKVAEIVSETMGRLDIIVNNAAYVGTTNIEGWSCSFESQSLTAWRQALEVNLTSVFHLCQSCKLLLEKSGHGSIINVGSIYGILGPDLSLYDDTDLNNPAAYAASKGGLLQLTRWLATVLAPSVRVNAVSPGGIERGQPEPFMSKYIARTPLKRMGREEDFKGVIAFLASDMSRWVTGQNIVVDGGWSIW